jgi:signal transduction histidine kinase
LLGLLKEDLKDRDYRAVSESVERLEQATDQLNQIIEDLLMLSRIGRKSLNLTEVDVHELVCELVDEFEDRIAEAGAKIDLGDRLPKVVADESDARRVFENLLTNALKYSCNVEDPVISVGGMKSSHEIRYFVRDRGPGIDPRYHERIFGLFQRLDTGQPGTGVGLASVAKILDMHGGRVWVESEPGRGATFWVAFPEPARSGNGANTELSREN